MKLVQLEIENNIATITLQNGKANAISPQVITELNEALDEAEKSQSVVILTGQDGIFSGGFDLAIMKKDIQSATDLVCSGSQLSHRMLSFPFPIIVASSGHAIAKGAFLLLSGDYRIGCSGKFKTGLNEVAIGMTMHHAGIEIARHRMPAPYFYRSVVNAEIFNPETAIAAGFLDEIVAPEQLAERATEVATQMKQLNMRAHKQTKLKTKAAYLEKLDWCIEQDAAHFDVLG